MLKKSRKKSQKKFHCKSCLYTSSNKLPVKNASILVGIKKIGPNIYSLQSTKMLIMLIKSRTLFSIAIIVREIISMLQVFPDTRRHAGLRKKLAV